MPIISTNQKLAQATPLIDLHGSGQILFFFLTAYINTSQLISNTTIPNDNMFHTLRNPKLRKPRTALVLQIFPQISLIFVLILFLRVGESPARESPGYTTPY